jgi:MoaA/NifB/PqqE/SkfB family radical SAM enzyme
MKWPTLWRRPSSEAPVRDTQFNVYNVAAILRERPDRFLWVRFDPNNDCNVHCVYCHNHRSKAVVETELLQRFLDRQVLALENFQMGCIMEPTLDKRLADLLLLVGSSPARPRQDFVLQTNGILLQMHDAAKLRDARLTRLQVSIDASDPDVHRALRGGTSIAKVAGNVTKFRASCPDVDAWFITTVTRVNVGSAVELVRYGMDLGVRKFIFREVFYMPDNNVVDHSRMPDLLLRPGEFRGMCEGLRNTFGDSVEFDFADEGRIETHLERMRRDSHR